LKEARISPAAPAGAVPAITALIEKLTVAPGGTLIGGLKVNTLVSSGGATVADALLSPIVAFSVSELRSDGLLTVTVTVCNSSVNSFELV
jgi:hypothetical protein